MKLIWYHRLICLWLAAFVLIGSSGHIVAEHWCKMKGKSMELLFTKKECKKQCPDKPKFASTGTGPIIYKSPCCKDVERFERLETKSQFSIKATDLNPPVIDWAGHFGLFHWLATLLPIESYHPTLYRADDPPSRSGRFRLTNHCIWLI
ncbi:HYC_CC_PP family protein [Larkinella humicola]|uniref:Uncharacterized protein n=1 Tax=Larkinella humicola TaxID=2607654 RepID=A0A5N1J4Z3_9BACT|nr:hypothetical protein [Larkinella humicola]KAA9341135.1 hypothetical protein F0P93_30330 [Larkinella humicola]